ncbi:MAG: single-stranded DNA-binding protein [Waterburya sp.]
MVNDVTLIGYVGKDPDFGEFSGTNIVNFSIATEEYDKTQPNNKGTSWHRIVAYSKLAELIRDYVKKGSKIYIRGRIKYEQFKDKQGIDKTITKIVANEIKFLDRRADSEQAVSNHSVNDQPNQPQQVVQSQPFQQKNNINTAKFMEQKDTPNFDDEIPF